MADKESRANVADLESDDGPDAVRPPRAVAALGRLIDAAIRAARWLVLPVSLLLFAQWPLRELVQAYSREANDLAQVLFAVYVAVAITAATRQGTHLAVDAFVAGRSTAKRRRIAQAAALLVLVPWSLFVLYAVTPLVASSFAQQEAFPDTFNPGYWIVKLAVGLMALFVLLQAIVAVFDPPAGNRE